MYVQIEVCVCVCVYSNSNGNSGKLAQKQTHRSVGQTREPRNNSSHSQSINFLLRVPRTYKGENIVFKKWGGEN